MAFRSALTADRATNDGQGSLRVGGQQAEAG
jgi:hypothetical protein